MQNAVDLSFLNMYAHIYLAKTWVKTYSAKNIIVLM